MGSLHDDVTSLPSVSMRSALAQNNNRIMLCETHDDTSTEIIRSTVGNNGQQFHGIWYSGLCQTTHLGIPDNETLPPLQRAYLLALDAESKREISNRPLCSAFDADSGGSIADIPALVATLNLIGVGMIVIEDKFVGAPGQKVNSLATGSAKQMLADPNEFAKVIRTFKAVTAQDGPMVTARIESFCCRVEKSDPEEEAKSYEEAHKDAMKRARIYYEAGVDAIMIHSKSKSPYEVTRFLREYRDFIDPETPLVVVPTTYSKTPREELYNAGANVVIYANHLMRAKISAVGSVSERILSQMDLFYNDDEVRAIVKARNYGCLLRKLRSRSHWSEESKEARMYRIVAEAIASQNIQATVLELVEGELSGCEADNRIITVKELLAINGRQVVPVKDLVSQVGVYWKDLAQLRST